MAHFVEASIDLSKLNLATGSEGGLTFKIGQPVTFPFYRNTQKSPNMGKTFGQHLELVGM